PSITSIFPPEQKLEQDQMNRADLPPSLRPGASPSSYPSSAPPYHSTFSTNVERRLSFQTVSSESQGPSSPINRIKGDVDSTVKHRPQNLQPIDAPTSRPRVSPPPSPAPAGAGIPATLIPGSRFSSNLGSIDVWADIRLALDYSAKNPVEKRRPVIKLGAGADKPIARSVPQQQAPVSRPTELPGPSRQEVSPPRAERRRRPTSSPVEAPLSRQNTRYHGDWVVVPASRPTSVPSVPKQGRRSSSDSYVAPVIPQLQLGAPFPVLINKRISHIQRDEGVQTRPLQPQAPATAAAEPAPIPSRASSARNSSIETALETSVTPLNVTRQPPIRQGSTDTVCSQPSRSNTVFFAESAQLTPSPSLAAAIQSVTREMSVDLSEPSESGSAVHWDVVDTVLKRHGAGRRNSLPLVMKPQSLKLTSESLESVDCCIRGEEIAAVCGQVEHVDHFDHESLEEDEDSGDEDDYHSEIESEIDELLAAWEEEDRAASPTKAVSATVKRIRSEKRQQEQLWADVRGLLASRGRQGSCETTTTLSSLDTDAKSPTSTYSH
ncbi:hypothetical protein FRB90_007636, partial [Tulasnella sp. 427]